MSRTLRSRRAIRQLPSPMWLIRIESLGKSIAYISVKWASPSSAWPADTSAAVTASPSPAKPKPLAIRVDAAAIGSRANRPSSAIASKWVE
jgi:hypothetical protein